MKYVAKPKHPLWRRLLLPFFYPEQLKSLAPAVLLCILAATFFGDSILFLVLLGIGYIAYVTSVQSFVPYYLTISEEDIQKALTILDAVPSYSRKHDDLKWDRRLIIPWMRSDLDRIYVKYDGGMHIATGRGQDMKALAKAINQKLR